MIYLYRRAGCPVYHVLAVTNGGLRAARPTEKVYHHPLLPPPYFGLYRTRI